MLTETAAYKLRPPLKLPYREYVKSYWEHCNTEYTESFSKFWPTVLCDPPGLSMDTFRQHNQIELFVHALRTGLQW